MVYMYTMQRTQIYLSDREIEALDREARETGVTRSRLIREAIAARYQAAPDAGAAERALRASAGTWKGRRTTGAATVERLRGGRLARLHAGR